MANKEIGYERTSVYIPKYLHKCMDIYSAIKDISGISELFHHTLEDILANGQDFLRVLDGSKEPRTLKDQLLENYNKRHKGKPK